MVTMVRFEQKLPITFYSPLWFQACMKIRLEKSHSILLLSAEWCISSSSGFLLYLIYFFYLIFYIFFYKTFHSTPLNSNWTKWCQVRCILGRLHFFLLDTGKSSNYWNINYNRLKREFSEAQRKHNTPHLPKILIEKTILNFPLQF